MKARDLTAALGGRWHGSYGTARCPAHEDRTPSLRLCDGDIATLLKCFAGCEFRAVSDALKARGLWPDSGAGKSSYNPPPKAPQRRRDDDVAKRSEAARALWNRAQPAPGTLVETYLASRGITAAIPPTIRYLAGAKHAETGLYLPCMIAAIARWPSCEIVAVHRTFLKANGEGKAPVSSPKKMLGPVAGGAVRLASHGPTLIVAEGIETAMTLLQETEYPVWAALSKGGIENLILPDDVTEVIIAADHDEPGLAAANKAARKWTAEGRKVRIAKPPIEGWDFNDQLMSKNVALFPGRTANG